MATKKKWKLPSAFRSRSYIYAVSGSILGIIAAKLVPINLTLPVTIVTIFGALVTGKQIQAGIDASKGQYYNKETNTLEKIKDVSNEDSVDEAV